MQSLKKNVIAQFLWTNDKNVLEKHQFTISRQKDFCPHPLSILVYMCVYSTLCHCLDQQAVAQGYTYPLLLLINNMV